LDASKPAGTAVLGCLTGSGSTLVATAKTRRIGHRIELDPIYCDVIQSRLAQFLKADLILPTGQTFAEIAPEHADGATDQGSPRRSSTTMRLHRREECDEFARADETQCVKIAATLASSLLASLKYSYYLNRIF
jgi:hypothetical protein